MSIDNSLAIDLNRWGLHNLGLTTFLGNDLVYIFLLIAGIWIFATEIQRMKKESLSFRFLKRAVIELIINFVLPLVLAVAVSEGLSAIISRDRPFVALKGISLVFPHDADGGMPSHHILFMVALAVCIRSQSRKLGDILIILALISGIARIAAGIHFPSDIAVGALLGIAIVKSYQYLIIKNKVLALMNLESITQ
jgi:undecaprenyl-diphosphatase